MINIRLENLIKIYGVEYLTSLDYKELLKINGMTKKCIRDIMRYKKLA